MDLEAVFYEQLKNFFLSPAEISDHLAKADENLAEKEELLRVLEEEQRKVEQEIKRVYQLYMDGGVSAEGFSRFHKPLEERQRQLESEIPRLQAELDVLKINQISSDEVLTEARDLYGGWPRLNREEKQRVVESITDKIVVGKGEIAISLCYLPSSEIMTKEQRRL
jgi:site-specific DNA recombinase